MRSIAINFNDKELSINWNGEVRDRDVHIQDLMINAMTIKGSDAGWVDRGTALFDQAVRGMLISSIAAQHLCNFAALDLQLFERSVSSPIVSVKATPAEIGDGKLRVNLQATLSDGTKIGKPLQI